LKKISKKFQKIVRCGSQPHRLAVSVLEAAGAIAHGQEKEKRSMGSTMGKHRLYGTFQGRETAS
tara:strand:+ start:14663 stop:14854 length:192 start_codon:yes stop_codon:yes gene_type:complete